MGNLSDLLQQFSPIALPDMKRVALLDRVDTKFILHKDQLTVILEQLKKHYLLLQIGSHRMSTYRNLYFDTEDFRFYKDHHNGKLNRIKIRKRKYVETDQTYLEVKLKSNTGKTTKHRKEVGYFEPQLSPQHGDFLSPFYANTGALRPVLSNQFKRMTLVDLVNHERITLDMHLESKGQQGSMSFENLVIAEVKQLRFTRDTPFFRIFRERNIRPLSMSKYCIGMASLHTELKQNTFKEKLLRIHKIEA